MQALSRIVRSLIISSIAASMALTAVPNSSHAGDVAWDNGSLDFLWNTTSANFGGAAWNNAGNDGAVFATTGVGNISLANAITVRSIHVIADGYTFDNGGAG